MTMAVSRARYCRAVCRRETGRPGRQSKDRPARTMQNRTVPSLRLHLDAESCPLVLEHDGDRLDDPFVEVCLAEHDHLVLDPLSAVDVGEMLLGKPVVPAAVPGGEHVGIFLESSGELGTR